MNKPELMTPHTLTAPQQRINHNGSLRLLFLCMSMVALSSCASNFPENEFSQTAETMKNPIYTLGPGDKIRVMVYEHEDLSGSYSVDDNGRISLPLVLGVNANGNTVSELEKTITSKLSENFIINPKVSVDVIQRRPFCILGEVKNPGCYSHIHRLNSTQAVAIAGGFTYRAYKNKFAITREDGSKVAGDTNTPINGGDTLEIFERYF